MRNRVPTRRRRSAAALAGTLALALAMAAGMGNALAEDEEEVPWDTKILRQFLKDLGLQRDGEQIEYRERAPLVVPPSRNLPPPQAAGALNSNPAWPNDPDVRQRKADTTNKKKPYRSAAEATIEDARPLSRSELEVGRIPAGTGSAKRGQTPEESARPMRPAELGSKSIFSGMFSSFGPDKGETGTFTSEPARESLTAPPPGYQTPSPNQPYGLAPAKPQAAKPEDRLTGGR
jgi:hypothetical protein